MCNLKNMFNNNSLYSKEVFKVFKLKGEVYELDKREFSNFKNYIGCGQDKIVTFCHKCKKEFPFEANKRYINFYRDNFNASLNMPLSKDSNRAVRLDIKSGSIFGLILPCSKDEFYENQIGYIEYSFTCKNDSSHVYLMFISVEFNNGEFTVRKVGQNPSMLTVKGFDFDKYKKQLDRINAYEDYKKADLSNADHFYVGAHAYLRRIFEKLINWYVDEYNVKLSDDRMKTKIDSVKQYFDPRINKLLKNLYSILSVSIHELDEDESKDYYSYLKAIIDMQLEYEYTEEEKAKQSSQLSAVIGKIESSLKKKKK